ncbi:MAG TPA: DUF6155 family protein [Pyrinomonadaceae bacterium]
MNPSWNMVRKHLATLDKPALVGLINDLYELSSDNRDFIQGRFQPEENQGEVLKKYRKKIVEQFYPARGEAKLKLAEARKAIKDYRKATNDVRGTAELMMTFVEQGAEFTYEYGDIDERFYSNVSSVLNELARLLLFEAREVYAQLSERLERVEQSTRDVGWGFHDHIADVVWQLEDEFD